MRVQREAALTAVAEDAAEDVGLALLSDRVEFFAAGVDGIEESRDMFIEGHGLFESTLQAPEGLIELRRVVPSLGDGITCVVALGCFAECAS